MGRRQRSSRGGQDHARAPHRAAGKVPRDLPQGDQGRHGAPAPGFVAATGDPLTARTLPTCFGVLELLLKAGVTTVAEAAFQDHVWRPRLEPLRDLAHIRVVQCTVTADVARDRVLQRLKRDPSYQPDQHLTAAGADAIWVGVLEGA